ncbi:MAG: hypothetical protein ACI9WU_004266 [Myxococcota bacterium]|jgi:hypothetical protein
MSQHDWDGALDDFDALRARRPQPTVIDLDAERRAFLVSKPWSSFKADIAQRLDRTDTRSRLNWTLWLSGLAFACSAAVALVTVVSQPMVSSGPVDPYSQIRSKGGGTAGVTFDGEPVRLEVLADGQAIVEGAQLTQGAELTFRVDSGAYDHVIVFSVEASGTITPYYPDMASGSSVVIGRGRGLWLPDSVVLDDSLQAERLVAVFSAQPLDWSVVRAAAVRVVAEGSGIQFGALDLPKTQEASIWFGKAR